MHPEHLPYYTFKKNITHGGYMITVYENTTEKTLKRFAISIFIGKEKIGEAQTDNDTTTIKKIKAIIDKGLEQGGRLEFSNLE